MDFFLLPQIAPFSVALAALAAIGLIEGLGMLIAGVAGISHVLDSSVDLDLDFTGTTTLLDWLVVRGMPLMVTVVAALGGFAVSGLLAQALANVAGLGLMSLPAAVSVGVVGAMGCIRATGSVFRKLNLSGSTEAVSVHGLLGLTALMQEPARHGQPALAHVRDPHGTLHLVMVEPPTEGLELRPHQKVELISRNGSAYQGR